MKKILAILLAMTMVFMFAACTESDPSSTAEDPSSETVSVADDESSEDTQPVTGKVGVSMPTQSLQRWNQDGANLKEKLEAEGYEVEVQFAGDDVATQVNQVETMIANGCNVLVIAAIDGSSFTSVLEGAKDKGITVIAYDRLIMDTPEVSYYATFDNWQVGVHQAQYLVDKLDVANQDGPFNFELFTGSPDDNNINYFFGGAMEVLDPYIAEGKIVIPSGQTEKLQVATQGWSTEEAQRRMEDLISSQGYGPTGKKLDAVMSNNDSIAQGVANALQGVGGYTAGEGFPLISGQDCDITSVKNMIAGTQAMSVFKDTRVLAEQVLGMIQAVLKGEEPEINDTESYDNGTGIIPSYNCELIDCDINNYESVLLDSGYYTEADLAS